MANLDRNPQTRQLITDSYARFLQVILESRLPTSGDGSASTLSAHRSGGPAFNLVLGKCGPMADKAEPWSRGAWEPMVIDILYLRQGSKSAVGQKLVQNVKKLAAQGSLKIALEASGSEAAIFLERWTVEFVQHRGASSSKMEREPGFFMEKGIIGRYWRAAQNNKFKIIPLRFNERVGALSKDDHEAIHIVVEKNLSILLRSLYSTARLLPAYNLYRLLSTTGSRRKSRLVYRVLTSNPPLPESDKKDMMMFCLPPAECHCGHLRISVTYRQTVPLEEQNTSSLPPHIIMDYVGKVDKYQLKQLPGEKIAHGHSLPSAQRLSPSKASNLQLHQPATQHRALKEGQSWALVQTNENETFDCPFAINEELHDRKESMKLLSVKSDAGVHGNCPQEVSSSGSLLAMLRPPEPLRRTRENLFLSHEPKKRAADALKELKMYIDFKDNLLSKCK